MTDNFKIVRAGNKFAIIEGDRTLVYMKTRRDAIIWIERCKIFRREEAEFAAECRALRVARAGEYLARRAERLPQPRQLPLL